MKIALVGFGNVGSAFIELLYEQREHLAKQYKFKPKVIAVIARRGTALSKTGFKRTADVKFDGKAILYEKAIRDAEVIVEVTPTDVQTGGIALEHCRVALKMGKHVVTANKGPLVVAYRELEKLARQKKVQLRFEGTVMGGIPSMILGLDVMSIANLKEVRGIFNSTTNFILAEMESGRTYADALKTAQQLGYAETDPTADVEGWDAAAKAAIIANTLMGGDLRINDVDREGITTITPQMITDAKEKNSRWKLIANVKRTDSGVTASARPMLLSYDDPLAQVNGAASALTYFTDVLAPITLIGSGAGGKATSFALLTDLIRIHVGNG